MRNFVWNSIIELVIKVEKRINKESIRIEKKIKNYPIIYKYYVKVKYYYNNLNGSAIFMRYPFIRKGLVMPVEGEY